MNPELNRRPLATRSTGWAQAVARWLAATSITPNQISVLSVVIALYGTLWLLQNPSPQGWLCLALCIQLRLLCNLLDGMVAIEGNKGSALGGLFNEVPDRIADSLFIIAAGYAAGTPSLGWCGALVAALTAYIRALGGSLGLAQDFRGPQAKPQRMFVLTLASLLGSLELHLAGTHLAVQGALWVIAAGGALTCVRRLQAIAAALQEREDRAAEALPGSEEVAP